MESGNLPRWWSYPRACEHGHRRGPGNPGSLLTEPVLRSQCRSPAWPAGRQAANLTLTLEEAAQSGEPGVGPAGEEPSVDLMSIGQFAGLSRLSAKALRLYDELGLLPLARVDPDSGYRWYAAGQLDNARMVASLRQIGVPLAQIHLILSLEPEAAAAQVGAYWSGTEADHAARRDLAGYLVDRLTGKSNVM
jgi:DNA-binding transcriptional MerR regulator